ncbi:MAG: beta strand repeat-containing protein, partial [Planctomycetota bacterium]
MPSLLRALFVFLLVAVSGFAFSQQTMTAPNGAETFEAGESITVTWTDTTYTTSVDIFFSPTGAAPWTLLLGGTANDGTESVSLPVITSTVTARILVEEDTTGGALNDPGDTSDADFTVTPKLLSPNGGETFADGSSANVTWEQASFATGTVDIFYSATGAAPWGTVLVNTTNDGSHSLAIPSGTTSNGRFLVEEATTSGATNDPFDTSDAVFTVAAITISLPGGAGQHDYDEDASPERIDQNATFSDSRSGTIAYTSGGILTVDCTTNSTTNDRLTVVDHGAVTVVPGAPNEVYVNGGFTLIGTFPQAGFGAGDGVGLNVLQVSLNGNVTSDDLADLLRAISYENISNAPAASIDVSYSLNVNDGVVGLSTSGLVAPLTINPSNDSPVLGGIAAPPISWVEDVTGAQQISGGATLSDPDIPSGIDMNGGQLLVTITNVEALDSVFIVAAGNITVVAGEVRHSGNAIGDIHATNNGTLGNPLQIDFDTSDATIAAIIELLQTITYDNTSNNPVVGTRTITFDLDDGSGAGNSASNQESIDVAVTASNDAPTLTLTVGVTPFQEGDAATPIAPAAGNTLTDPDSADFDGGSLSATYTSGNTSNDQLLIDPLSNNVRVVGTDVEFSPTPPTGFFPVGTVPAAGTGSGINGEDLVITFIAACTPGIAEAVLNAIAYHNADDNPSATSRVVRFICDDGDTSGISNQPQRTITFAPVNDAPDLQGVVGNLTYVENGIPAVILTAGMSIVDPDDTDFNGGTLTADVSVNGTTSDQLSVVDNGTTINVSDGGAVWNIRDGGAVLIGTYPKTGAQSGVDGDPLVVSLVAGATFALTEDLIEAIGYANSSDNPLDTAKTVSFTLNDGDDDSNTPTATVTVTATNDDPVAVVNAPAGTLMIDEDNTGTIELAFTDVDILYASGTGEARVVLSATNGILTLDNLTNLTFNSGTTDASKLLDFQGPVADVLDAIDFVDYDPDQHYNGSDTINFTIHDLANYGSPASSPTNLSDMTTISVAVAAVNDDPVASAPASLTLDEDTTDTVSLSFTDTDISEPAGSGEARVTLTSTNGILSLNGPLGASITFTVGADDSSNMTFHGLVAEVSAAISSVTYTPDQDYFSNLSGTTDQIFFEIDDMGNTGGSSLTDSETIVVTVDPVNDAPTFVDGPGLAPFAPGDFDQSGGIQWATDLVYGPSNETSGLPGEQGQDFDSFLLTLDGAASFGTASYSAGNGPSIDDSGVLTFVINTTTPFIAVYNVQLVDDEGTPNGGNDTSAMGRMIIANLQDEVYVDIAEATVSGFDGTNDVDDAAETVTVTAHSLANGESVVYSNGGQNTVAGLSDATTYWVHVLDANTVSLHTSQADALADTNRIDLTDTGGSAANSFTYIVYGTATPAFGGRFLGIDAFIVVQDGVDKVNDSGTVYVNTGSYAEAYINRDMTIDLSAGNVTLNGNNGVALEVDDADVTVTGAAGTTAINQASASGDNAVYVYSDGSLTITDVDITQDANETAVYLEGGGTQSFTDCTVTQNSDGDAVYVDADSTFTTCTITQHGDGNAVLIDTGSTFDTCTISHTGDGDGSTSGNVVWIRAQSTFDDCVITQDSDGRAVFIVADSNFDGGSITHTGQSGAATTSGQALTIANGSSNIDNVDITQNSDTAQAVAIGGPGTPSASFDGGSITQNSDHTAVAVGANADASFVSITITQNSDNDCVALGTSGDVDFDNTTITQDGDGNALSVAGANVTLVDTTINESSTGDFLCVLFSSGSLDASAGGNTFAIVGADGRFIEAVASTSNVDATSNTWDNNGSGLDPATRVGGFEIEDHILHAIDDSARGFVRIEATTVYVTTNSGLIQRGVNAANAGDTLEVQAGLFAELVTVNKPLTMQGEQFGADADSRFSTFPATLPVETVIQPPAPGAVDVISVTADDISINGFVIDGDAPGGAAKDARHGVAFTGISDNLLVEHTVFMNLTGCGVESDRQPTETLVNTGNTTFDQTNSSVAHDGSGNYVVVWESLTGVGNRDVFGQRYNASGTPIGGHFQVNDVATTGNQERPSVSMNASGQFVVVWQTNHLGGQYDVHARLYTSSGAPFASEFPMNTASPDWQWYPSVTMNSGGDFAASWTGADTGGEGIFARVFSNVGTPLAPEFLVNDAPPNAQTYSSISSDSAGNIVVAWQDNVGDGSGWGIFARQFNNVG